MPETTVSPHNDLPSLRWGERIETGFRVLNDSQFLYLPSLRWGERIETMATGFADATLPDLPSLRWGERIETCTCVGRASGVTISPLTSVGGAD